MTTSTELAHDLAITAIDLTRACAAHELYCVWLQRHTASLNGPAGIAGYLCRAAFAFEEEVHNLGLESPDLFTARENLSDILMASVPLPYEELRAAARTAITEADSDSKEERDETDDRLRKRHRCSTVCW